MVEVLSAGSSVEDTSLVELEGKSVSFNGNRDWLFGNSSSESILVTLWDISERLNCDESLLGGLRANSVSSSVWVIRLGN